MIKINNYFNTDYFSVLPEGGIIEKCASSIKRKDIHNSRVLIIAPCLIGDFVATLPAIFDYMERNKSNTFDVVVTPVLKSLVKKVLGVHRVYIAKSMSERKVEDHNLINNIHAQYEKVMILRSSRDVLRNVIPYIEAREVVTVTKQVAKYGGVDLFKNLVLRRRPTQWRDFNFHLLGGKPRHIDIKEILDIKDEDFDFIKNLQEFSNDRKNIIIHTGASWPMMSWPKERWVHFLQKVENEKYNFIFVGSSKDKETYDYISSHLNIKPVSLIGKTNMFELILLFLKADLFVGIDSGPGNVAHFVGLQSIVLYGPGPHTFMSYLEGDIIIDKSNGRGLYQRFFLKKKGFIHKITVEEVCNAFCSVLK